MKRSGLGGQGHSKNRKRNIKGQNSLTLPKTKILKNEINKMRASHAKWQKSLQIENKMKIQIYDYEYDLDYYLFTI